MPRLSVRAERDDLANFSPVLALLGAHVAVFGDFLVGHCLGPFNSGCHVAGYRHGISTRFPQIGEPSDDGFSAGVMD